MTATPCTTARPRSAAIAWVSGDYLFVEYPTRQGVPYIVRYHRTLTDLTLALNILIDHSDAPPPTPAPASAPHPAVKRVAPSFSEDQRESVRAILKAKGIL